jgi:azurin
MAHNFVLLKIGTNIDKFLADGAPHRATDFISPALMSSVIAQKSLAGPGETVQVTFTVPSKPGRYPYLCTFAGHYQAGMKGVLIVK